MRPPTSSVGPRVAFSLTQRAIQPCRIPTALYLLVDLARDHYQVRGYPLEPRTYSIALARYSSTTNTALPYESAAAVLVLVTMTDDNWMVWRTPRPRCIACTIVWRRCRPPPLPRAWHAMDCCARWRGSSSLPVPPLRLSPRALPPPLLLLLRRRLHEQGVYTSKAATRELSGSRQADSTFIAILSYGMV